LRIFEERSYGEAFHSGSFASMQSNAEHIREKRLCHAEMCNVDGSCKADASQKMRDLMIACRKCNLFLIGEFN